MYATEPRDGNPCPCAPATIWRLSRGTTWSETPSPLGTSALDLDRLAEAAGYQAALEWEGASQQLTLTVYSPADTAGGQHWLFLLCTLGAGCELLMADDAPSLTRLLADLVPAMAAGAALDELESMHDAARRRTPEPPPPPRPRTPRTPRGWRRT
jgi:hypothetical protein